MGDVLTATDLSKAYHGRPAVRSVSLELRAGQVVCLLGPNGAGKTTTFYMLAGLLGVDSGNILFNGKDITGSFMHTRVRMGLGYLPQGVSIFRQLSAEDNIRIALEARTDLDARGIERELETLIEQLQINAFRKTLGISLSGGECRRVEFARTLATGPKFVLLDEPFVGMDPLLVADVQKIVTEWAKNGIGLLIIDHNVREALSVCDYAYIMKDGGILAKGRPGEVLKNEKVLAYYLGMGFSLSTDV